ncbi:MAG: hypothetical protein WDO19_14500 [Bacteroidota bacterium]
MKKKTETTVTTSELKTGVTKSDFGTVDGKPVYLYTLTNANGDR